MKLDTAEIIKASSIGSVFLEIETIKTFYQLKNPIFSCLRFPCTASLNRICLFTNLLMDSIAAANANSTLLDSIFLMMIENYGSEIAIAN